VTKTESNSPGQDPAFPPSSRRPPGRREELLAAALQVIRRDGPDASMEEMAAAAGITKPVLYRYFGDRDGLIGAVADDFAEAIVEKLQEALSGLEEAPPDVMLRAGIDAYVSFIEEDPYLYGFLTQQAPPDSAALVAVVDRVADPIAVLIAFRLEQAGLDPAPALTWAHGIVGMVHMAGARWARQPDMAREELVSHLVALVGYGLVSGGVPVQPQG
jgi:AcrR family transcriptional regulator